MEFFARRKVSKILPPALIGKGLSCSLLSSGNDCMENIMVAFIGLMNLYTTKVGGLGKILSSKNFHVILYMAWHGMAWHGILPVCACVRVRKVGSGDHGGVPHNIVVK